MRELMLVPAYGRDYASETCAESGWRGGSDFKIVSGPYCSVRDVEALKADGFSHVRIYYALRAKHILLSL